MNCFAAPFCVGASARTDKLSSTALDQVLDRCAAGCYANSRVNRVAQFWEVGASEDNRRRVTNGASLRDAADRPLCLSYVMSPLSQQSDVVYVRRYF
jgi:endo-1,4-beta-D-glucanase Y